MAFTALTARAAATYARIAPAIALFEHVKGVRPLNQATKLMPKNDITAKLTAIGLALSGII
jgi:hypothetical protein